MQKLLTFFSKNISVYAIFNDQSFNDTLTNDIVSFDQLGPRLVHDLEHKYDRAISFPHIMLTTERVKRKNVFGKYADIKSQV